VDRARAYAATKGWAVDDAHVYVDDGISGAEFEKRPGYVALMATSRTRRRQGGPLATLITEMQRLEGHRHDLLARLEHLDGLARVAASWDPTALAGEFQTLLGEWHTLLRGEPVQARQILRKLITGRLRMTPEIRPDGRFYRWTGQA
jgi:hypothetical protein